MTTDTPVDIDLVDLTAIARQARTNSERWFPRVHDPDRQAAPLAVHYALGLVGEAGELANLAKKALRLGNAEGAAFLATEAGPELADVFTYLVLLADELGVDLLNAFVEKQAVCEARWGQP